MQPTTPISTTLPATACDTNVPAARAESPVKVTYPKRSLQRAASDGDHGSGYLADVDSSPAKRAKGSAISAQLDTSATTTDATAEAILMSSTTNATNGAIADTQVQGSQAADMSGDVSSDIGGSDLSDSDFEASDGVSKGDGSNESEDGDGEGGGDRGEENKDEERKQIVLFDVSGKLDVAKKRFRLN